ncbi:MAG: hypothetical protein AB7P43_16915, partial [Methylocystis sp.]|uniref:hypothetical protein n=1 Tax=Methylocystis sp. TaxID=1911079 RepID=UPI003D0F2BF0
MRADATSQNERVADRMADSSQTINRRRLQSGSGLTVTANANGSSRRMSHQEVLVNLFLGDDIEGGPAN